MKERERSDGERKREGIWHRSEDPVTTTTKRERETRTGKAPLVTHSQSDKCLGPLLIGPS